eukprot:3606130-Pyramimonas_sp.AAC.1
MEKCKDTTRVYLVISESLAMTKRGSGFSLDECNDTFKRDPGMPSTLPKPNPPPTSKARPQARVSQVAGVQAEGEFDMTTTIEISTSGTGVTETRGMILVTGGVAGKGDAAQKSQCDIVEAGPNCKTASWGRRTRCARALWPELGNNCSGGERRVSSAFRPLATTVER